MIRVNDSIKRNWESTIRRKKQWSPWSVLQYLFCNLCDKNILCRGLGLGIDSWVIEATVMC